MGELRREPAGEARETDEQIARKAEAAIEGMGMRDRIRLARVLSRVFVWDRKREEWI